MAEEALQYGDFCLAGEGEESFPLLVENLTDEGAWADIPGLSYWRGGEMHHNPPSEELIDLDTVPIPDLDLLEGVEQ